MIPSVDIRKVSQDVEVEFFRCPRCGNRTYFPMTVDLGLSLLMFSEGIVSAIQELHERINSLGEVKP